MSDLQMDLSQKVIHVWNVNLLHREWNSLVMTKANGQGKWTNEAVKVWPEMLHSFFCFSSFVTTPLTLSFYVTSRHCFLNITVSKDKTRGTFCVLVCLVYSSVLQVVSPLPYLPPPPKPDKLCVWTCVWTCVWMLTGASLCQSVLSAWTGWVPAATMWFIFSRPWHPHPLSSPTRLHSTCKWSVGPTRHKSVAAHCCVDCS